MGTFNRLDEKFGVEQDEDIPEAEITAFEPGTEVVLHTIEAPAEDTVKQDMDLARTTLHGLLASGETALQGILEVASQSDHPRAYEVAANLIGTIANAAKDLMEIQKRGKELTRKEAEASPGAKIGTQNNFVFAGSTKDLLKALKDEVV